MSTIEVRVARKTQEADGIVSLELTPVDGKALPAFSAGAHVDVEIRPGLVRQYSLLNSPGEINQYRIAVLKEPASRGGSTAMHLLGEGDRIRISAPRNHFPLQPSQRAVLFGGGIGITPLVAMAEELHHAGASFELHYSCRSPRRAAFVDHLAGKPYASGVSVYFDEQDARGPINIQEVLGKIDRSSHLYLCGPQGYLDYLTGAARAAGWSDSHIHIERFTNTVDESGNAEFEVKLASSGAVYRIPADRSIVEVLAEQGIELPVSCEQGVCGTCVTPVLGGRLVHRDVFLTDAEKAANDRMTPCCSRGIGLVTLDL